MCLYTPNIIIITSFVDVYLDLGAPFFTGAPAELWHHPLAYADMPTAATATALQHAALVHPALHPHPQQVVCDN